MPAEPVPGVRLLDVLREDAVGTFAVGVDVATGARVGVRRLHGKHEGDDGARLLFAEEVRRVATLDDPLLLRTLRHDAAAPVPWMVTEAIDGETLEGDVARAAWPSDLARGFAASVARAFLALASRRQFHAAPVPSRIVRVGEGWRLLTFRDVRAEDEASRLRGRVAALGPFAAPELAAGSTAPITGRSLCVHAVGALWSFLRAGGAGPARPAAASTDPDDAIVARLLEPDPVRRPPDAASVLALLGEAPPPAPTRRSWRERPG
ncbi:MAG TPA: hypothetical protein VND21_00325 [Planctomycetota bacterium]|nr:hypothetical protein [Planctomycetota bacterium]